MFSKIYQEKLGLVTLNGGSYLYSVMEQINY